MTRFALPFVAAAILFAPLRADVTVKQNVSGKGLGLAGDSESVTYIRGGKMRTDQKLGEQTLSTIIDIDAQKMILLNAKKKEAQVTDRAQLNQELQQITDADIKVQLTPGTEKRSILGHTATKHEMRITVAYAPAPDQKMDVVLGGPVWIAKDAPGHAEYAAFYKTAAERGFIFTDPRVAKAQPAQAKGFASFYRSVANAGVPLASDIEVRIEGSGLMATMMSKMGKVVMSSEVTAITTDAVSEEMFTIPAGYKIKTTK